MALSDKAKKGLMITGGILFLVGVGSFAIYKYNQNKESRKAEEAGATPTPVSHAKPKNKLVVGGLGGSLTPIAVGGRPNAVLVTQGRG